MAKRLATEYVKTSLRLTECEMEQFVARLHDDAVDLRIKVCENGGQELALHDARRNEGLSLPFARKDGRYVIADGAFRLTSPNLAEIVRKAIVQYKGSGTVHRIYASFTIIYEYAHGKVIKISESSDGQEKCIYEYRDSIDQLEHIYKRKHVENKIEDTRMEIDKLLDLRNRVSGTKQTKIVDRQLAGEVKKLFVLEA